MRSNLKKLDSLTLGMSKNHLNRTFLRNGLLRVKQVYSSFIKVSDIEHQLALINEFGFSHECIDVTARSTTGTTINRLEFDDVILRYPMYDPEEWTIIGTEWSIHYEIFINPYWRGFSIKGYYLHYYKLMSFFSNIA